MKFDSVVTRLATLLVGWQWLKPVDGHLATSESTKGLSRVLELDTSEFGILRMKAAEFMHVDGKIGGAKGTIEGMAHAPESPKHFSPRLELHTKAF